VVFRLDQTGKEMVLYTFAVGTGGTTPLGGLVRGPAGSLYSTTYLGGADNNGVVFKVDPSGEETVLYTFTGLADGGGPTTGLVGDKSGNLYGITTGGGDVSGCYCGVVFKLTLPPANESGPN
jgi:uncharacterized repeat protein (TIGR03803 family)